MDNRSYGQIMKDTNTAICGIADAMQMPYSKYKKSYVDCKTVGGTYNRFDKTIYVIVSPERLKSSGVRGERYNYFPDVKIYDKNGDSFTVCLKAICWDNALKQIKRNGWKLREQYIAE
jgi:hypothetical protein